MWGGVVVTMSTVAAWKGKSSSLLFKVMKNWQTLALEQRQPSIGKPTPREGPEW